MNEDREMYARSSAQLRDGSCNRSVGTTPKLSDKEKPPDEASGGVPTPTKRGTVTLVPDPSCGGSSVPDAGVAFPTAESIVLPQEPVVNALSGSRASSPGWLRRPLG